MSETIRIAGLSDIEKIEEIPYEERIKEKSTYELIAKGAAVNPEAIAISLLLNGDSYEKPQQLSYSELMAKINQTSNMLHDLGVGPTDVVTYVLPNLPQTFFVLWGAETTGIANPVNPLLEPSTIKDICQAVGTKVLVALGDTPGTDIWQKVDAIRKDLPGLKAVLRVMGPSDEAEGIYGFEETMEKYPSDRLVFERSIGPDDIASIYHTGGTTGRPKLACRSHYNEVVMAWDLGVATELGPRETVMMGLPLFHCNGTIITGLLPFSVGGHVIILSPSGYREESVLRKFYDIVAHYRPVLFSCVPTVLSALLDVPKGDADVSSLRYVICGAAPLSVEVFNQFEEKTGMKILEGYGLTETAVASACNPKDGARKIGSVGVRLPYHWIRIIILDEKGNYVRDAETNEIGVIAIKGPCVFKGYVEEPHNRGIWIDGDWFNTGDMGRQDQGGYLWLTGRRKELIIRGGHNIDPATIEEALYKIPYVKVAAAVGRPDSYAGEVPIAYVELAKGVSVSNEQIMDGVRKHIGERAATPKAVEIVDRIPMTAVGKIFKPALRWDAIRKTYEKELKRIDGLVSSVDVSVGEDQKHGTGIKITVTSAAGKDAGEIEAEISEILARYTLKYDLSIR